MESTNKEDDGGTGGDDAPRGDQAESGGTVGAADSHISDADSGTAGIADEMSVQKAESPDHRDHGEGSTTDTAEPAGDTELLTISVKKDYFGFGRRYRR